MLTGRVKQVLDNHDGNVADHSYGSIPFHRLTNGYVPSKTTEKPSNTITKTLDHSRVLKMCYMGN